MANRPVTGTNVEHTRRHNRRVVLEAIRQHGRLTRAQLTGITALTAQAISNIVAELLDDAMLVAHPPLRSARGQPPIPLSINPDGGYAIGFHVARHRIVAVLTDLGGVTRARLVFEADHPTFDAALPLLLRGVSAFRRKAPANRLLGIGVGLPGPFGVPSLGTAGRAGMPEWDHARSVTILQRRTGLPVLLENDATAAAMGERLYGAAGAARDFAYLFVGHGFGSGFYLDNRLYEGHWGNAGEVGQVVLRPGGKACGFGQRGSLECYVSGAALLGCLGLPAQGNLGSLDLADPRYARGIRRWLAAAAPALRSAIHMLESLLDPELVLLGGTLPDAILRALLARTLPLLPSISTRDGAARERVRLGTAGPDCVALGAASLLILAALSPDYETLLKP